MTNDLVALEKRTISSQEIVAALEQSEGILVDAAKLLGVRRFELEDIINGDEHLSRVHISLIEEVIDRAQKNVFKAVSDGNYTASIFVLQNIGKERGFSTRAELTLKSTAKDVNQMSEKELVDYLEASGIKIEFAEDRTPQATLPPVLQSNRLGS